MRGGGGNELTKFTLLEMWGNRQYIYNTKKIFFLFVYPPYEKISFPQKLDMLDCVHYFTTTKIIYH